MSVGADKGYDTKDFVAGVRALRAVPHVARKKRGSALDGRTTRHAGYAVSQRRRKLVEEPFGWMKTCGGLRKLRHRGKARVSAIYTFACAAYNLVRLRTLLAEPALP
jgi:IS5 family transposase